MGERRQGPAARPRSGGTDTSERTSLRGKVSVNKERESKEDGRYIIFYTFEDGEPGETSAEDEEG